MTLFQSQKSSSVARHELLSKKTKKVAWFVSNCGAKNKRLEYALELGEHIEVDIYGGYVRSCDSIVASL